LEYFNQTGEKISEHNARERGKTSVWNSACFVLTDDRRCLYERIDRRVDKMISNGLVGEVRELKRKGCRRDMVSMQGLGYKEILDYLDSRCTLEEAVYTVKRDSRHFAKRQLTWFRREKDVIWLDRTKLKTDEEILNCIMEILRQKGIAGAGT
jgi:tRNA dimethylallyltransferase